MAKLGQKNKCVAWLEKQYLCRLFLKVWKIPLCKTIVEFSLGLLLSLLWFVMMTKQMELSVKVSLAVSAVLGLLFSVGLAFSPSVRCVVLLMLPSLCSSKGRALLLGYTFILVLNHPMENFKVNFQVASDSITCTQEMGQEKSSVLVDAHLAPSRALLESMSVVLLSVNQFSKKVQRTIIEVRDLFREVLASISKIMKWMGGMEVNCNEKMGGPYKKCKAALDVAYQDCRKKLKLLRGLCNVLKVVDKICNIARIGELLCMIPKAVKQVAVEFIKNNVVIIMKNIVEEFLFEVDIQYVYNVTMVQSKSFEEISRDIRAAIVRKLGPFYRILQLADIIVFLLILLVFLKAYLYRRKFLSKDSYDNTYLSKLLLILDKRRKSMRKTGIFPMSYRERKKYIRVSSCRLISAEKRKLFTGFVLLFGTVIHGSLYLILDAGLYWILKLIQVVGKMTITEEIPSHLKLHVEGDGVLADVYRSLFTQFDPLDKGEVSMETGQCLPRPVTPNWNIYKLVVGLYFVCLILVIIEAYVLRLRHFIAGWFYQDRKKDRAVWLYSHILRRKGRLFQIGQPIDKDNTTMSRIVARFPFLGKLLKPFGYSFQMCTMCGTARKKAENNGIKACDNLGCKALYCEECLPELHNLCMSCSLPVDYSLTADFEEERDSSEEETEGTWTRHGYH